MHKDENVEVSKGAEPSGRSNYPDRGHSRRFNRSRGMDGCINIHIYEDRGTEDSQSYMGK